LMYRPHGRVRAQALSLVQNKTEAHEQVLVLAATPPRPECGTRGVFRDARAGCAPETLESGLSPVCNP
jgi:hypothetical protein